MIEDTASNKRTIDAEKDGKHGESTATWEKEVKKAEENGTQKVSALLPQPPSPF